MFDDEIARFFATEPYEVGADLDPHTGQHVVHLRIRQEPPLRLGTIIGDFAQNTRAALDHLVWQLTILNGRCPTRQSAFPIRHEPGPKTDAEIKKRLRKLSAAHRARIEAAQPYHAGNDAKSHLLALLAQFSNTDKHQVIHPTLGYLDASLTRDNIVIYDPDGRPCPDVKVRGLLAAGGRRLTGNTELARLTIGHPNPKVLVQGEFPCEIAVGDNWLKASVLPRIHDWVGEFIETFAPDFPDDRPVTPRHL